MASKAKTTVEAFLVDCDHPLKAVVLELREHLLAAAPSIGEEIKWNAPSFHTTEHFATMYLRDSKSVQLILHLGAKRQSLPMNAITDPRGLLKWLGDDRAVVRFESQSDLQDKAVGLREIIRQWIRHVGADGNPRR